MMRQLLALALTLCTVAGCKKDQRENSDDPSAQSGDQAGAQTLKLWDHAPPDAIFGVVIGEGTLGRVMGLAEESLRIFGSLPKGKELIGQMRGEMTANAPFDVLDAKAYPGVGLDLGKATALFVDKNKDVAAIFPVGDREKFRKLAKTKTEKVDGVEVDRIGGDGYCILDKGLYVCADSVAMAQAVIGKKGKEGALPTRAKALAGELRGDAEFVVLLDQIPDAQNDLKELAPALTNIKTGALSLRMSGGRMVVRGWLEGTPPGPVKSSLAALPHDQSLRNAGAGAVSAWLLRVPLEATGVLKQLPPSMPVNNYDLRKILVDELTGEAAFYTVPSKSALGFGVVLAVGMKDTSELAKVLGQLCGMTSVLPFLDLKPGQGSCSGTFDPKKIPDPDVQKLFPGTLPVFVEAKGKRLILALGAEPKSGDVASQAASALTKEMLTGKWNAVMWGRYSDPFAGNGRSLKTLVDQSLAGAPPEVEDIMQLGRLMVAHLYETGIAFRLDDKGAHLALEVTSMAADPPEVYAEYSKTVAEGLKSGGDYADKIAALGKKHPKSLVAKQGELSVSGAPSLAASFGVVAAIAVPAFMKYVERSREAKEMMVPQ